MKSLHFAEAATRAQRGLVIHTAHCQQSQSSVFCPRDEVSPGPHQPLTSGLGSLGKQLLAWPYPHTPKTGAGPHSNASPQGQMLSPSRTSTLFSNFKSQSEALSPPALLTKQSIQMTPTLGCNPPEAARCYLGGCSHRGDSKMLLRDQVALWSLLFIRKKNSAKLMSYVLGSAEPLGTWTG